MRDVRSAIVLVLVLAAALGVSGRLGGGASPAPAATVEIDGARYRLDAGEAERAGAAHLDPELRAASLRFGPEVSPQDRRLVLDAVAAARPDARRLIELVDGLVVFRAGAPSSGAIGQARWTGHEYEVLVDLATLWRLQGARGVTNVVLHELGHVVDGALLPDALVAGLDAGIPQGQGCDEWRRGGCAPVEERFADTFAKWATGDLGFELYVGYSIPPPDAPLERWGLPLAGFGR